MGTTDARKQIKFQIISSFTVRLCPGQHCLGIPTIPFLENVDASKLPVNMQILFRWSIYRISGMRDRGVSGMRDRAIGGLTPQLLRNVTAKERHQHRDAPHENQEDLSPRRTGSTASDTTCSSGKYADYTSDTPSITLTNKTFSDDD